MQIPIKIVMDPALTLLIVFYLLSVITLTIVKIIRELKRGGILNE